MFVNRSNLLISNGKALAVLFPENKGLILSQFKVVKYEERLAPLLETPPTQLTIRSMGEVRFLHGHQECCDAVFGKPPTLNEVLTYLHQRITE